MGEFKLRLDSCALKSPKTTNRKIVYCNPDFCTVISKLLHILTNKLPTNKRQQLPDGDIFLLNIRLQLTRRYIRNYYYMPRKIKWLGNIHRDDPVIMVIDEMAKPSKRKLSEYKPASFYILCLCVKYNFFYVL